MANNKLAIIGEAVYMMLKNLKKRTIRYKHPWGKPSDKILKTNYKNKEVFFTKTRKVNLLIHLV